MEPAVWATRHIQGDSWLRDFVLKACVDDSKLQEAARNDTWVPRKAVCVGFGESGCIPVVGVVS